MIGLMLWWCMMKGDADAFVVLVVVVELRSDNFLCGVTDADEEPGRPSDDKVLVRAGGNAGLAVDTGDWVATLAATRGCFVSSCH